MFVCVCVCVCVCVKGSDRAWLLNCYILSSAVGMSTGPNTGSVLRFP